jgi:hypothetical protein
MSLISLVIIPVFSLWMGFWFYMFHIASLDKTKKVIFEILKEAEKGF